MRTLSGTTRAGREANLSFDVGGTIEAIRAQVGDSLDPGRVIARLDPRPYELEVERTNADLIRTRAEERSARANYLRIRELYETNNASRNELDTARASADSAAALVGSTHRSLEIAQLNLADTELRATESCLVASVNAEVNENVLAGQSVVEVTCGEATEVALTVPESLVGGMSRGMEATIGFDAIPETPFTGAVTEVGVASGEGAVFPVTLALHESHPRLRSGLAAEVTFHFTATGSDLAEHSPTARRGGPGSRWPLRLSGRASRTRSWHHTPPSGLDRRADTGRSGDSEWSQPRGSYRDRRSRHDPRRAESPRGLSPAPRSRPDKVKRAMNITRFAIRNDRLTLMLVLTLSIFGILAYFGLPKAQDPGFTIRTAVVTTYLPGANPQRVEQLITDRVEQELQQMPELDNVSSDSQAGISVVYANFKESYRDMRPIFDDLRRKVERVAPDLPVGAIGPIVNDEFGDVFGVIYALTGDGFSYAELKEVADSLRNSLLLLENVAKVDILGQQEEVVYVEYNNARLRELGLSPQQLRNSLQSLNTLSSGGDIRLGRERISLEPTGNFESVDAIRGATIAIPGTSEVVQLEDIALVSRGYKDPRQTTVHANGRPRVGDRHLDEGGRRHP